MHRRCAALCLALAALTALAVPATAPAKGKKAKLPVITKVTPMRLRVGSTVTIRGRRFSSRRKRNTVVFRSSSGRSAFAKPIRASRKKLVVRVPAAVARIVGLNPSRVKLRVLVAGKFSKFTSKRLSPVIVPTGVRGGPGEESPCKGADLDGDDLLSASLENDIGTDPCLADTDGDGMTDGWEFYAARDLNIKAVPYPGKRPFVNALDPSDGKAGDVDFDGDGLSSYEEYRAWRLTGSSFISTPPALESRLGYSDGTKFSRSGETPAVPAWRSASHGQTNPAQPFPATFNLNGDLAWRDDERDADRDGLSNWLESSIGRASGPSDNKWWEGFWASDRFNPTIDPWKKKSYCGFRPGFFEERPFANLDLTDADVDGDSLLDGEDDQDNDDFTNITELYEVSYDLDGNGNPAWCGWSPGVVPSISFGGGDAPVNAMNPCVPDPDSRTCHDYIPF